MVRILKLHEADEATIMKLLPRYKSISRQDADFEIELYKKSILKVIQPENWQK